MPERRQPWIGLTISTAVHAALLLLAVRLSHTTPAKEPAGEESTPAEPERAVRMLYLPPPPKPAPPPPPKPVPPPPAPSPRPAPPPVVAPPPEKRQPDPEPEPNAPPEATRVEGRGSPETEPAGAKDAATPAPTMESEAKRIFGRPRQGTRFGAGPRAVRPLEVLVPENPEKCTPHPVAPSDSAGSPQLGVVQGTIFRQDDGRPLAGAHLQMLGTPYVAFTDDQGEYRFRFDLSLVDNCRTQYVRVSAPGYESRLLVLVVGQNIRSEDVLLRRR